MAQKPSPDMALRGPFQGCEDSRGGHGGGGAVEIAMTSCSVDGFPRTAPWRYTFRLLEGARTCNLACIDPMTLTRSSHGLKARYFYLCTERPWDTATGRGTSNLPGPRVMLGQTANDLRRERCRTQKPLPGAPRPPPRARPGDSAPRTG